jgi:class 3 adenylate cyclase
MQQARPTPAPSGAGLAGPVAAAPEDTILIVDDQPANVAMLSSILKGAGYRNVVGRTDSRETLLLYDKLQPDLLLLDLHMPHLDGLGVLRQLRAAIPADVYFPVLLLTADGSVATKERALSLGANDFLAKPFSRTEVLLRIHNLLETRRLHVRLAKQTQLVRQLLGRYVAAPLVDHLLEDASRTELGGTRVEATVLFSDLRGFTEISESLAAEEAVTLLNQFLSPMVDIVLSYGGTLDKFRGDGIMALFGVPAQRPDDALNAVRAALEMQALLSRLEVPGQPRRRLQMGVGINTGTVVAGNIGSERRHDFTVIGDAVNVAARFESNAGPGQVLITDQTWQQVQRWVNGQSIGTLRVKGKQEWIEAYQVLGLRAAPRSRQAAVKRVIRRRHDAAVPSLLRLPQVAAGGLLTAAG